MHEVNARQVDGPQPGDESPQHEIRRDYDRERFLRNAPRRTDRVLKSIEVLKHCASRAAYRYSDHEANQILDAIADATRKLELAFFPPDKKAKREPFALAPQDGLDGL